ncbi:YkvA family protein [Cytobacillus massiliigabonensis]|uniref:YkvA family protein n=1 Tax=Cytobacillus massiliigabonensis TaxID=1871011 RepID=UPI000C8183E5|nr:YkvA family protein [Cytobacillus massiliigabonensis]
MPDEKKYEAGYRKFLSKAQKYVDNPQETDQLLKKTEKKAKGNKASFTGVWEKFQLLIELVRSWSSGEYRAISKKSILFIIASILYFVSPIDIIPDFLIGLGIVDDAAVIAFAIKQLTDELEKYKIWKRNQPINAEESKRI